MADDKKSYFINIESNLQKYALEAAEAKKKVDELKAANDLLKQSGKEGTAEFEVSEAALKNANDEYRKAASQVKTQIAANGSEAGSRKQLSEVLKLQMQDLGKLGSAYIKNAQGQKELNPLYIEQRKRISETKQAIIDYDLALNDGRSNVGRYSESLNGALGKISSLPGPLGNAAKGITGVTKASWAFIATPIGAVIGALVLVIGLVVKAFKTFDPLIDKIQQGIAGLTAAFTFIKESVVALFTGQEKLNGSMRDAVKAGVELKKMEQELDDMNWKLIEGEAKKKRQIDELLLQSKDRTKSEKERIALIDEALKIEEAAYEEKKKVAEKEQEIAQDKIITGRGLTEQEIANIKELGVAYAISLKDKRGITDEEIQNLAEANAKIETVLNESVMIREKAINRQNVILDKQLEDDKKRTEKRVEAEKKANDAIIKAREEMDKAISDLDDMFYSNMEEGIKTSQDTIDKNLQNREDKHQQKLLIDAQNRRSILENAVTSEYELKVTQLQADYDLEIAAAAETGADVLLIEKKFAGYKLILEKETQKSKYQVIANFAGSVAGLLKKNTIAHKIAAVAEASINTYLGASAAFTAMAKIPPAPVWGVIAAASAVAAGLANVAAIVGVNPDSPSAPSAPTAITSSPIAQRTFAPQVNPTILNQPQLTQPQLNALPQGMLTAAEIGKEIAKLPAPVVYVEAFEKVSNAKRKVETRATI